MSEENIFYIGRKLVMNYFLAVLTSLQYESDTRARLTSRLRTSR
jgi:DNA-binding protein